MDINFDKKRRYFALSLLLILIGVKTNFAIAFLGILVGIKGYLEFRGS